ncbi:MAG TPA: hypothetical protein VGJ95_04715 [Pseudonocardiaceae bacterium]
MRYRDSVLASDDREPSSRGALRAGDRAPDGPYDARRMLFDLFRGPHSTVLNFGRHPIHPGYPPSIVQVHAVPTPPAGYDLPPGAVVVVRADGYLGLVTEDPLAVAGYPEHLFGAARAADRAALGHDHHSGNGAVDGGSLTEVAR